MIPKARISFKEVTSVRAIDNIVDCKLCLHDVDEDLIRGIIKDWLVRAKID